MVKFYRAPGGWAFAVRRDGERVQVWRIQRTRWIEEAALPAVANPLSWALIASALDLSDVHRAREAGVSWAEHVALTLHGGLPAGSFPGTLATALVHGTEIPEDEELEQGPLLAEVCLDAARDRWVELCASKVERALAALREAVERVERLTTLDLEREQQSEIRSLARRLLPAEPEATRSTIPAPLPRDTVPLLALVG